MRRRRRDACLPACAISRRSRVAKWMNRGATPAIVILHGLAGSSHEFISRAAFVNDVVQVIEKEGPQPVDLVGQSMGAPTAMLVASAHPELVRRLVLLEGNEGGGSAEDHAALGTFFRSWEVPFTSTEKAIEFLGDGPLAQAWVDGLEEREDGLHPRFDADVMVRIISDVAVPRWSEWESTDVPTLVVYADGGMFAEGQKAEFVSRGKNVTRADLTGASHDAHLDAFEQWSTVLHGFLTAR